MRSQDNNEVHGSVDIGGLSLPVRVLFWMFLWLQRSLLCRVYSNDQHRGMNCSQNYTASSFVDMDHRFCPKLGRVWIRPELCIVYGIIVEASKRVNYMLLQQSLGALSVHLSQKFSHAKRPQVSKICDNQVCSDLVQCESNAMALLHDQALVKLLSLLVSQFG